MTWSEHLLQAERLGKNRCAVNLMELMTDARIVGLVAFLHEIEQGFTAAVSAQALAGAQGKLAHCAGSLYAVRMIRHHLQGVLRARAAPGGVPGDTPRP